MNPAIYIGQDLNPKDLETFVARHGKHQSTWRHETRRSSDAERLVPVALPDAALPRERWLSHAEAVRLMGGCLGFSLVHTRHVETRREVWMSEGQPMDRVNRHAARFVMLGLRTDTRHEAILSLGWHPHIKGGWAGSWSALLHDGRRGADQQAQAPRNDIRWLMRHMRRLKT